MPDGRDVEAAVGGASLDPVAMEHSFEQRSAEDASDVFAAFGPVGA